MCYHRNMVKSSKSELVAARRRRNELRSHYHEHRVKRGGQWYNPLLDDPGHPDNKRHWTHGTIEGYNDAGCACGRCGPVGQKENQRKAQARIDRRLSGHRSIAASVIAGHVLGLSADIVVDLAEAVVATHRVSDRFRARIVYDQMLVELTLQNWALTTGRQLDASAAGEIAARLVEELTA